MAQYKGAASEAGRAMQLMKKREKEREQLEQLKQKIAEVCNFYSKLLHFLSCPWSLNPDSIQRSLNNCLWGGHYGP